MTTTTTTPTTTVPDRRTIIKSILRKIEEYSTGTVKDSHAFKDVGFNILDHVRSDTILRSALGIKYSTIRSASYYFIGDLSTQKLNRLKELRFDRWYGQQWWQTLMYKNVFTELGRDSAGRVTQMSVIKTDQMEIINDTRGNVKGYLQIISNADSKKFTQEFNKDNIVHFSFDNLGNSLWGESEIPVLQKVLFTKSIVEGFLAWRVQSNQFRPVIKIPDQLNVEDVEVYLNMLKSGMQDPTNFLVLQGDEAEISKLSEIEGFTELLKYVDNLRLEALAVLQVPPILVGILDNSNRSNAEYQIRYNFYTHIYSLFHELEDEVNNELLPKLGLNDITLKHSIIDAQGKKDLLDIAQKLGSVGANHTKLNKWLIDNGLDIPKDLLEEEVDDVAEGVEIGKNKSSNIKLDKNSDQHPSRQSHETNFAGGSRTK